MGICLLLPLSLLKSKFVLWIIRKSTDDSSCGNKEKKAYVSSAVADNAPPSETAAGSPAEPVANLLTREQLTALYQALRSTVKACGHFDLVHVHSSDGHIVRIRI